MHLAERLRSYEAEKFGHAVTLGGYKIEYKDDGSIKKSQTCILDSDHDIGTDGYDLYSNKFDGDDLCWILENWQLLNSVNPCLKKFRVPVAKFCSLALCTLNTPCAGLCDLSG